jgi:hypothetical protein
VAAGALIAGLGIVGLLDVATGANIDWRIVLAVAAVVLGALVAAGAATGHGVGAVVVLALAVLAAFAIAAAVRVPLFAGIGDRLVRPATIASVDSRYKLGIGNLEVDLSGVRFPVGETHVRSTLGIGDLVVDVPNDVTVEVAARASAGEVNVFGRTANGKAVDEHVTVPGTDSTRVLVLDARVGLGQVEVQRG